MGYDIAKCLDAACQGARVAGMAIMEVYQTNFVVDKKSDQSPVTEADRQAHRAISAYLAKTGFPLLSEEAEHSPYEERENWEYFWLVDPLDGTKEFVRKTGNFTVNIALIHQNQPVLGVMLLPTTGQVCYAIKDKGAFSIDKLGRKEKIHTAQKFAPCAKGLKVITSSHNYNGNTAAFLADFPEADVLHLGSAAKLMRLAEGHINMCPRFGTTMEWDTAAPQIIIEEAGGQIVDFEYKKPLIYNKPNLENPNFLAIDCKYWENGTENWELKIMS